MIDQYWWKCGHKDNPHEPIFGVLEKLRIDIDSRNDLYQRLLSIYMNRQVGPIGQGGITAGTSLVEVYNTRNEPRMVLNASESCVATLGARIASEPPRPRFLTAINGPDVWDLGLKAEQLEKFVVGTWEKEKVYKKAVKVFFDAAILGFGALKVYEGDGKVEFERVFPGEIVVDERASMFCEPRSLYTAKDLPSEVVMAEFADNKAARVAIEDAISSRDSSGMHPSGALTGDMVKVVEAWHLPSGYGAKDGKHVICVEGYTLFYEEYKRTEFPFVIFKWDEPPIGWYPMGLIEREEPIQKQINKYLQRIQESMHLFAAPKYIIEEGAIEKSHMRNMIGDVLWKKKGAPDPKVHMPPSMSSEIYKYIWELYDKIFEDTGVSKLSAASKKPAGVESGVALRTLADQESGRFALKHGAWEAFHVELAEHTVYIGKQIYKRGGEFKVRFTDRNSEFAEEIDWKDVDLDKDQYELKVFPTNALPHTPAGKIATVEEMLNAGIIDDPVEAKALLKFPDLDQAWSLDTAALKDIDMQISQMLGKGEYEPPMEYQNLELGLKRVTSAFLWARSKQAPEDRLELLLQWLEDARSLLAPEPEPEPQPPPQEMMPPPEAMPPQEMMPPEGLPPEGMPMPPMPPGGMPPEGGGAPPVPGMPQ